MQENQKTKNEAVINITCKNRLSLSEVNAFVNEVVNSCFEYNNNTKMEEYDPTFIDFMIKAAILKYYSDYYIQARKAYEKIYVDEKVVTEAVNDVNRIYEFCCDNIILNEERIKELGIDWSQLSVMITVIYEKVAHKARIIENSAGFVYFINELDGKIKLFMECISNILSGISEGIGDVNAQSILEEINKKFDPKIIVDEYVKSEMKKAHDKEVEAIRKGKKEIKNKKESFQTKNEKNIIPMANYKKEKS